jgi:hypothetical protein
MSGGGGLLGGARRGASARAEQLYLDGLYGPGWREATLKTLEQELKERGIEPMPGDDRIEVCRTATSWPLTIAAPVVVCVLLAFMLFLYVAVWEVTPDSPGEFCPSPFASCERAR